MDILIGSKQSGKTILAILKYDMSFSSSVITFLKKSASGILLNGEHATVRQIVKPGDLLSIDYTDKEEIGTSGIIPVDLPISVVYKDNDLFVINKHSAMPTHPSHNHQTDTLANAVAYRCLIENEPFVFRAINRLDVDTSGVVIIARNKLSASRLSESLKKGEIRKEYFAVLHGKVSPAFGTISSPIRRATDSRMKREICDTDSPGAHPALSEYRTLCANQLYSAVIASPVTGRTHQLRVHFDSIGCPIVGDTLYGTPSDWIKRQALHAYAITFPHPVSGETVHVKAPVPDDIQELCRTVFAPDEFTVLEEFFL